MLRGRSNLHAFSWLEGLQLSLLHVLAGVTTCRDSSQTNNGLQASETGQNAIVLCCRLSRGAVGRQASLDMQRHRISANPHGEATAPIALVWRVLSLTAVLSGLLASHARAMNPLNLAHAAGRACASHPSGLAPAEVPPSCSAAMHAGLSRWWGVVQSLPLPWDTATPSSWTAMVQSTAAGKIKRWVPLPPLVCQPSHAAL